MLMLLRPRRIRDPLAGSFIVYRLKAGERPGRHYAVVFAAVDPAARSKTLIPAG
ncbi:hypothetical protein [Burkholderia cepacia]|uniref:hypothetical protein n=1 Tax=Burkholderia cepacia TaxID=292 RepID=UPI002AB73CB6|nr:hypothetical protein [Burkholderia cepacia]